MFDLFTFYRSKEWAEFRQLIIEQRTKDDGFIYDEVTGKPILKAYDLILHHKEELTEENVNDYNVSLNPDNIMVVSHKTHNLIHDKLGMKKTREVFLVYGPPLAGKTTWVKDNKNDGDLVIDLDNIWESITGGPRYSKPPRLKAVAFKIRDAEIEAAKYRQGKWLNAYIIGGYPLQGERERLAKELGAREIYIEASEAECIARLEAEPDGGRDKEEWRGYIAEWFRRYTPGYTEG